MFQIVSTSWGLAGLGAEVGVLGGQGQKLGRCDD